MPKHPAEPFPPTHWSLFAAALGHGEQHNVVRRKLSDRHFVRFFSRQNARRYAHRITMRRKSPTLHHSVAIGNHGIASVARRLLMTSQIVGRYAQGRAQSTLRLPDNAVSLFSPTDNRAIFDGNLFRPTHFPVLPASVLLLKKARLLTNTSDLFTKTARLLWVKVCLFIPTLRLLASYRHFESKSRDGCVKRLAASFGRYAGDVKRHAVRPKRRTVSVKRRTFFVAFVTIFDKLPAIFIRFSTANRVKPASWPGSAGFSTLRRRFHHRFQ